MIKNTDEPARETLSAARDPRHGGDHFHHRHTSAEEHTHHPAHRGPFVPPHAQPSMLSPSGFHRQPDPQRPSPGTRFLKRAASWNTATYVAEAAGPALTGGTAMVAIGLGINAVQYPFTGNFDLLPMDLVLEKGAKVAGLTLAIELGIDEVLRETAKQAARSLKKTPVGRILPGAPPRGGASEALEKRHEHHAHTHSGGWLKAAIKDVRNGDLKGPAGRLLTHFSKQTKHALVVGGITAGVAEGINLVHLGITRELAFSHENVVHTALGAGGFDIAVEAGLEFVDLGVDGWAHKKAHKVLHKAHESIQWSRDRIRGLPARITGKRPGPGTTKSSYGPNYRTLPSPQTKMKRRHLPGP
jgi:hypothetical protein